MELIIAPLFAPFAVLPFAGIAWTALWLWMLVDAILRKDHEYPGTWEYRRVAWVLAIALVHVTALVYLFAVFARGRRTAPAAETAQTQEHAAAVPDGASA